MPFETVLARAARVVHDRLSNATVTWQGSPTPVRARWDDRYLETMGVSSSGPRVTFHPDDVPGIAPGQTVTKGLITYTIDSVEPDNEGQVVCPLTRNG